MKEKQTKEDNGRIASIDLGVNNLATIAFNTDTKPFIMNGRPLKSINQFFNKRKAQLQEIIKRRNDKDWSNRMQKLQNKRNKKIKDYMHKASRYIVNQLVSNDITTLVIGKNDGWKQDTNMGDQNNQNFVQIPFNTFIQMICYKCQLEGIKVVLTNESYTSRCSFIDNEPICKQGKYAGKRTKRGLFRSLGGTTINADLNGAYNILRKVVSGFSFDKLKNEIEGVVVHPRLITV